MTRSPIPRVLSTIRKHEVEALLMGGQACVLYGAAEFSRDADLAILLSAENLQRLRAALDELQAEPIAVPPFELQYLERGHSVHFRCKHPEASGFRIDVMARMRGVAPFPELWRRRTTVELPPHLSIDLLSLPDLIASKKTQRDKDWPMIRRLVEVSYHQGHADPRPAQIDLWLRELRTPELLVQLTRRFPEDARRLEPERASLSDALRGDISTLLAALESEVAREREADRVYWEPLRKELEMLRHRGREAS